MNPTPTTPPSGPGINLGDIYYVLFRQKWKILICGCLGLAAAYAMYRLRPPPMQSDATLFVRFVISEGTSLPTQDATAKSPDQRGETIMNSEVAIITSWDLAKEVAEAVGPEKVLGPDGKGGVNGAASVINAGMTVTVPPRSSLITISFKHKDREVVQPVLKEIIARYLKTHNEIHRSKGMLGDFLVQETDQYRARLLQTEEELRKARAKVGVVSVEDSKRYISTQIGLLRQYVSDAQAQLAGRSSLIELTEKQSAPATPAATDGEKPAPPAAEEPLSPEVIQAYRTALTQMESFFRAEQELLLQFKPEHPRVKEIQESLARATADKRALEEKHPQLIRRATPVTATGAPAPVSTDPALNVAVANADIASLNAKIKVWNAQIENLHAEAARLDQAEAEISQLRRKWELEDTNYRQYAASLERQRISETLGNGRVSNISQVQTPTPPYADWTKTYKTIGALAVAGFIGGLAWAFAIEFYFDRSIRRPTHCERLGIPLFLDIPKVKLTRQRKGGLPSKSTPLLMDNDTPLPAGLSGEAPGIVAPHEDDIAMAPFAETLRDRLISYFESKGLTHKPKLVAVSGLQGSAGVTTIAAGLARSLSETGEGNVLLVDMTDKQGTSHHFVKGNELCGIDELLDTRDSAQVDGNLYVVSGSDKTNQLSRNLPQRFTKLIPKLKASDFDYIIFDMPAVSQLSITPRLAGFMDMVLLVVESEKTNRDLVQSAADLLATSRAHVGMVLNKTHAYVPTRLHQELLH